MKKWLLFVLLLTANHVQSGAQTSGTFNDDNQLWPDVSVSFRLTPKVTMGLFGTARIGQNRENFVNEQLGIAVTFRPNQYLSIAPSYRHLWSQPDITRRSQENRYFIDVTPRLPLRKGFTFLNRNRTELRDIQNVASWRYRNRPMIEKAFTWDNHQLIAYAAGEVFYDSRFHEWNRKQYWIGTRIPVSQHLTMDLHYSRVTDLRARPGDLHILGVFSRFEF